MTELTLGIELFCMKSMCGQNVESLYASDTCYIRRLLGVTVLTLRLLMSYIYMEHLFLMFLDYTQRRTTVGRTPLDE